MHQGIRVVPMAVVMGTIFFLSQQPATDLSFHLISGLDKVAHAVVYACLAATAIYAMPQQFRTSKPTHTVILVVAFCLVYGISDEYHQSFIPGRQPSLGDLLADTVGAALLAVGWLKWLKYNSHRNPKDNSNSC